MAASEIARAKGKTKSIKTAKTALAAAVATVAIGSTAQAATVSATPVTETGTAIEAWGGVVNVDPTSGTAKETGTMALGTGAYVHAEDSTAIGQNAQMNSFDYSGFTADQMTDDMKA